MTEREAYVAFNLTDQIGSVRLAALVAEHGSAVAAWDAYPKKLSRTGGEIDWRAEFKTAEKFGVTIVTALDEGYPDILRKMDGHPLVLYVKGDVAALSRPSVALVGTRRATEYGRHVAGVLAYDLAKAGWAIVSGLALGIDAAAHRGALDANGVTVGIIGSGLDRFYPDENRELAREMVRAGGAVVSEFPFGRPADKTTFPIRNHVVAALTRGVVAVEAPVKSGTLITTGFAADLGRVVMAVPARVDNRMSAGCLHLIREGATLVRNADDVLEALAPLGRPTRKDNAPTGEAPKTADAKDSEQPEYSAEEALVMLHVGDDPIALDELVRLTKLPSQKINALAMTLRLKGFIKLLPGNRISRSR